MTDVKNIPEAPSRVQPPKNTDSIRRRIAHMLGHFGCNDALDWPEKRASASVSGEAHPIDIDSLQLVELALHIEAEFDIDFRDDLIPPAATLGDFVDMVEAALRQKAVDRRPNDIKKETI
ncbi:MAG: acyl carrier protein [Acidithiobacillus sp.]